MINPAYFVGGAIPEDQSTSYVSRSADKEVLYEIQSMHYTLIIEPRQQGKTSLANVLLRSELPGYLFAYIDLTTLNQNTEDSFYASFAARLNEQLKKISYQRLNGNIRNSADFRKYLVGIAESLSNLKTRLVIILDEVGSISFPNSTIFFSVLRDLFNSRQVQPVLNSLTFVLIGAFHPKDLIRDKRISPFNIAHRVRLADFSREQVVELLNRGLKLEAMLDAIAERIMYWTDGQPYPTQFICSRLPDFPSTSDVDQIIEQFRKEDSNLFPPVLEKLDEDTELITYLLSIFHGKRVKFYPSDHPTQSKLELLGLIKEGENGLCKIRNRLYKESLEFYFSSKGNQDRSNKAWIVTLLKTIFVNTPSSIGYFIFDVFGRENAKSQTAIILGYLVILGIVAIVGGIVPVEKVTVLFKEGWDFFTGR